MSLASVVAERVEVHGTPAGYRAGCRGRAGCTSRITCEEASIRYAGDLEWRRLFDAGETADGIASLLAERARASHLEDLRIAKAERRRARGPRPRRGYVTKEVEHGTRNGYMNGGCTDEAACPGNGSGLTCIQASRDYAAARRAAARRERAERSGR